MTTNPDQCWTDITDLGTAGHLPALLLYGPPGTGKTQAAMSYLAPGERAYRMAMTEGTSETDLRGHWMKTGPETFEYVYSPAMLARRDGGRLVVDEITRGGGEVLAFLLAICDTHPLDLPHGETIMRHPNFSVWATTNDTPESLSDALRDRFPARIDCATVNPAALAALTPDLRHFVVESLAGKTRHGMTNRQAIEFQRLTLLAGRETAARLVFEGQAADILTALDVFNATNRSDARA